MSTVAQGAQRARAARSRSHARAEPRSKSRSSARTNVLGGGILWIVLFAALLAGVVAVNVAVLRLNLELDQAGRERAELQADVSALRSEISSASATARIERVATSELGLVQAEPEHTIYVRIKR
jgi:cell division protein FtsL